MKRIVKNLSRKERFRRWLHNAFAPYIGSVCQRCGTSEEKAKRREGWMPDYSLCGKCFMVLLRGR